MNKGNKISTRVKILGFLIVTITFGIVLSNLYLNKRIANDAYIMNIVGKERMLTQKIAKNIFYLYQTKTTNFKELNSAVEEFEQALTLLRDGDKPKQISSAPTKKIKSQINVVETQWSIYKKNINKFQEELLEKRDVNDMNLDLYVKAVYDVNVPLLNNVDKLVTLYNIHLNHKVTYIKWFQFGAFVVLMLLFAYIFSILKDIEKSANSFMDSIKSLENNTNIQDIKPINSIENADEFVEASQSINNFINRVNSAMKFSTNAIESSKLAANQLKEITSELGSISNNIENQANMTKELNKSEDIAIETTDELISTTKQLQKLKDELEKLKEKHQG